MLFSRACLLYVISKSRTNTAKLKYHFIKLKLIILIASEESNEMTGEVKEGVEEAVEEVPGH